MKRTAILSFGLIWAIVSVVSCNGIDTEDGTDRVGEPVPGDGKSVINAVAVAVGSDTKTHNAVCYEVLWDEGDRLFVTDGTNTDNFTLSDGAGGTRGTFIQDLDGNLNPSGTMITGEVEIFSPASLKVGDKYVWPAYQSADPPVPMYIRDIISGTGKEKVHFSGLGAVLQIVLTTSEKSIGLSKIRLYDADKPMSGEFTVEDGKAVITSTDKSGITVDLDNVTIGNAAKYFNISVPAGKYDNLNLEFVFSDGRTRRMVSTTMPEIERNTVAKIALFLDISRMPTSIKLEHHVLDLVPTDAFKFKVTVLPETAENKKVIWSSSDENVATVDQTGKVTALALGDCTITAMAEDSWLKDTCALTVIAVPSGALPGKFSVSENKKVFFSKGNMYYGTWIYNRKHKEGFYIEEAQWGRQPITDSISWRTDHKNHFYWSKIDIISRWENYPPNEGHETTSDVFFTNLTLDTPHPDFGVIINEAERKGIWRVLSTEEWEYLFRKRKMTYDKKRCSNWLGGMKMADGVIYKGLFIYPDDFNGESIEFETDWGKRSWKEIYDAGIVFLPAGGIRQGKEVSRVDRGWAPIGWYWSSDCNDTNQKQAHSMYFNDLIDPDVPDKGIVTEKTSHRGVAHTVRLVRDVWE